MLKQNLSQKLLQKLSPQQLMYVKLLELNTLNFEQRLEEELIENPALESGKDDDDFVSEFTEDSYTDIDADLGVDNTPEFEDSEIEAVDKAIEHAEISDDYLEEDGGDFRLNEDYNPEVEEKSFPIVTVNTSFRDSLMEQVYAVLNSETDGKIAEQIIGSLDDDGYLRRELRSISNDFLFQYNLKTTEEDLERICFLQSGLSQNGVWFLKTNHASISLMQVGCMELFQFFLHDKAVTSHALLLDK